MCGRGEGRGAKRGGRRREEETRGWKEYMESKKAKLEEQARAEGLVLKSRILDGVSVYVDGWTAMGTAQLRQLVREHAGHYSLYKSRATTHVVADTLPQSKLERLRGSDLVVHPDWLRDSVAAGQRLPETQYRLGRQMHGFGAMDAFVAKPDQPGPSDQADPADQPGPSDAAEEPADTSALPGPSTRKDRTMLKTTDPGFIADFYARSRLHHIATWAQERKDWVRRERRKRLAFPRAEALRRAGPPGPAPEEPVLAHIDMDCFFVSVIVAQRAELAGRPVGVCWGSGRGPDAGASWSEVASANYAARAAGVRNGMLLGKAKALCPDLATVQYDFPAYEKASISLYSAVAEFSVDMEAVSCDELYLDLGKLCQATGTAPLTAVAAVRAAVSEATGGCPVSAGLGPNLLLARLATRKAKPDGQFWLQRRQAEAHLASLPVADLPGVGRKTLRKLEEMGLERCGQLGPKLREELVKALGPKAAETLLRQAVGEDERRLGESEARKSVSCEINYGIRLADGAETLVFLTNLCREVARRLASAEVVCGELTLKVMIRAAGADVVAAKHMGHGVCDTVSRSARLPRPSGDAAALLRAAQGLLAKVPHRASDLRGLGLTATRLASDSPAKGPAASARDIARFFRPQQTSTPSGADGGPRKRLFRPRTRPPPLKPAAEADEKDAEEERTPHLRAPTTTLRRAQLAWAGLTDKSEIRDAVCVRIQVGAWSADQVCEVVELVRLAASSGHLVWAQALVRLLWREAGQRPDDGELRQLCDRAKEALAKVFAPIAGGVRLSIGCPHDSA